MCFPGTAPIFPVPADTWPHTANLSGQSGLRRAPYTARAECHPLSHPKSPHASRNGNGMMVALQERQASGMAGSVTKSTASSRTIACVCGDPMGFLTHSQASEPNDHHRCTERFVIGCWPWPGQELFPSHGAPSHRGASHLKLGCVRQTVLATMGARTYVIPSICGAEIS